MFRESLKRLSRSSVCSENPKYSPENDTSKRGAIKSLVSLLNRPACGISFEPTSPFLFAMLVRNHQEISPNLEISPSYDDIAPTNKQELLRMASEFGHYNLVRSILESTQADPTALECYAIRKAACNNHFQIAKLLLEDFRVDDSIREVFSERWPSELSNICMHLEASDNVAVRIACKEGDVERINTVISNPIVDPSARRNSALRAASRRGDYPVAKLLLQHPKVSPLADDGIAFANACKSGNLRLVRLFLSDPDLDFSSHGLAAMECCCLEDNVPAAKVLREDSRFSRFWSESTRLIRLAIRHKANGILPLFFSYPTFDAVNSTPGLLADAVHAENEDAAVLLLSNPKLALLMHAGILLPIRQGMKRVVEILVDKWNLDPSRPDNKGIVEAARNGSVDITRFLLKDSRVNPHAHRILSLWCTKSEQVAKALYPRVQTQAVYMSGVCTHAQEAPGAVLLRKIHQDALVYAGLCLSRVTVSTKRSIPEDVIREILAEWADTCCCCVSWNGDQFDSYGKQVLTLGFGG